LPTFLKGDVLIIFLDCPAALKSNEYKLLIGTLKSKLNLKASQVAASDEFQRVILMTGESMRSLATEFELYYFDQNAFPLISATFLPPSNLSSPKKNVYIPSRPRFTDWLYYLHFDDLYSCILQLAASKQSSTFRRSTNVFTGKRLFQDFELNKTGGVVKPALGTNQNQQATVVFFYATLQSRPCSKNRRKIDCDNSGYTTQPRN
ncbi:hypothetical protein T06_100, partial [Trichinella sp. T6]